MTQIKQTEVVCGCCGLQQEVGAVLSSNCRSGGPDLDLRRTSVLQGTLYLQVQCCSACGYCAPNITQVIYPNALTIIASEEYQNTLRHDKWLQTTRSMACWGLLAEAEGDLLNAGRAALKAAWNCDDGSMFLTLFLQRAANMLMRKDDSRITDAQYSITVASQFRELAGRRLTLAMDAGQMLYEEIGLSQAVLADVWRRAGQFERAIAVASSGLEYQASGALSSKVESMLRYQVSLATRQDFSRHTVSDAETRRQKK